MSFDGKGFCMADLSFKVRADGVSELDGVRKKYNDIKKDMGRGVSVGVGMQLSEMAFKGLDKIKDTITGVISDAVSEAAGRENLSIKLRPFFDNEAVREEMAELADVFGASPPFSADQASEMIKYLTQTGTAARDMGDELNALGNVAAGVGMPIENIGRKLMVASETGKVGMRELKEMIQSGVPVVEELARVMGVSKEKAAEMAQKSLIGFDQLKSALINLGSSGGKFDGAMDDLQRGFDGKVQAMKGAWGQFVEKLGTPLIDVLKPMIDAGIAGLQILEKHGESLAKSLVLLGAAGTPFVAVWASGKIATGVMKVVSAVGAIRAGMMGAVGSTNMLDESVKKTTASMSALALASKGVGVGGAGGVAGGAAKGFAAGTKGMMGKGMMLMGGPAGIAMLAGSLIAEQGFNKQEQIGKASDMFAETNKRLTGYDQKFRAMPGIIGSDQERNEALGSINEEIEAEMNRLEEAKNLEVGLFSGVSEEYKNAAISGVQGNIRNLNYFKEKIEEVTQAQMDYVNVENEKRAADLEALNAEKERAKNLEKQKKEYAEKKAKFNEEDALGGNGAAAIDYLKNKRNQIISGSGLGSKEEMEDFIGIYEKGGSEKEKAQAAKLYEELGKIMDLEKQIAEVEKKRDETLNKMDEDYKENVLAAEMEVQGRKKEAEELRKKVQIMRQIRELEQSGLTNAQARARAEEMINREFAVKSAEKAKEKEKEDSKKRKSMFDDFTEKDREKKAGEMRSPVADVALGVVKRMEQLTSEYGLSKGDARKRAMGELPADWMGGPVNVTSSIRAIGGGGSAATINAEPKKQTELLKQAVDLLGAIKSDGGL